MLLKGAAQQLAEMMIKLSNKYHSSEWAFGLEYELWNEISGNQDLLSDAETIKLRETSVWCEGWITMAFLEGEEQLTFVDLERWQVQYRENKPF
jgi:hypothetical protein